MDLFLASLVNLAIDCLHATVVVFGCDFARPATAAAPAESPLVAEARSDLAAFAAGTIAHAEFSARADARAAALTL